MGRAVARSRARLRNAESGFTLIELLVVIIILGILAGVVVFAVRGAGDKGQGPAHAIDARTIRTAQEAYCAREGRYAEAEELVAERFLSELPTYHQTNAVPVATPDASGNCTGAGDPSRGSFLITCDSGQSGCGGGGALPLAWQTQTSPAPANTFWREVSFVDHQRGWAVGGPVSGAPTSRIIATTDGGATWVTQTPPTLPANTDLWSVDFVDANRGWASGRNSVVIATTDGGATWGRQTMPAGVPTGSGATFRGIDFVDANNGWAVGGEGLIVRTTDGGATWTVIQGAGTYPGGFGNAVHFLNDQFGVVVGQSQPVLVTTDGGLSWQPRDPGPGSLEGVVLVNTTHGWAVGVGGRILATIDGGATWNQQPVVPFNQTSVDAVSARQAWSLSTNVAATTDGGATWNIQRTLPTPGEGIDFVDAAHGWVVGRGNLVWRYGPSPP